MVDPWWRWSCALVAGSGGVRACSEESRHFAMWVWFCTQTSNEFVTFFPNWWFMARSDKTWHTSMACYTSGDFITQVFWHSMTRWLLLLFKYHFVWMKMLTVSFLCALVCGYNVREWRKDWVFIRVQADVLCMLVCMWVRVSFLQKKLDAPPSLDRCKILFLYWIKLSFMKC